MEVVLRELTGTEFWIFRDDLMVFSDTFEEHASRLQHVLQHFDRGYKQLQIEKMCFCKTPSTVFGYIVSRDGITVSHDKVKAVRQYPKPRSVKDIRSYLGLV